MPLHGTAGTHPSATTGAAGGLRTPAGAAHLDLPADLPRADRRDRRPATEELALPAGTGARLRPSEDHRPAAFALAALCAVLHRHTGQDDFLLAAALPTTGPDPVLLRARFDPWAPFTALWDHLHEDTAGRADTPVGRPAEEAAEVPAVAFRYLTADDGTRDGPGGAPYDLAFTLDTTRTPMVLRLGYDAGLHERETAARLLRHTRTLLDAAGDEPGRPVAELPVEDGAVAAPRPWALPAPAGHLPPPAAGVTEGLVHRFKAVAAAHSDRPALRGPSGELRYADLDRITDTMAPRLPRPRRRRAPVASRCCARTTPARCWASGRR
ncbi:hypothetical protein SMD11_0164 [Streptomyces albireticuli]|uniref:Condensation domain-containing protein n=1 Tax=Streptomyces albireticuli TaxID=1940 RepID=A0A1Z2KUY6_9ACTN|nr:hypothetical protein [Streptomyces albireticuli]ARZ65830.1 hypothetical protein SMD11_0164 [Streptomyces albireticuli]